MKRFLSSAWYPFLISLLLAGAMAAVFWILEPSGEAIGSYSVAEAFTKYFVGYAAAGVVGLLAFLAICIVNLIRRIVRLRQVSWMHPIAVILGILPFLIFGWELTYVEPRFTPIARAIIDFIGEPMYAGSVIAVVIAILLGIPAFLPSGKRT